MLVLEPTTSAGAYVSSAHAGGSVGDVGLRMNWQSFSCSGEKNPPFLRVLGHWREEGGQSNEVRQEGKEKKGALEVGFMFQTVLLSLLFFLFFFVSPLLTVGAVRGRRGVGWISRKEGWDAQTEGEEGEVQRIQYRIVEDGHGRQ